MKRTIHDILLASQRLIAICFITALASSCADDFADDLVETGETYTLTLAIDTETPDSRTELTDMPIKTSWSVGDKVILHHYSPSADYEFEVASISGGIATFTHTGTIDYATNFSGTLSYSGGEESQVYPWGTTDPVTTDDHVASWRVQSSNNNFDHIQCIDALSAKLSSYNLTTGGIIKMKRTHGLIKVILRGFIYPISQGSILRISGFDKYHEGTAHLGLVLGNWTNHTVTINDGHETLNGDPFLDVSSNKDPLTTYAVDDGRTLVAYVPITDTRIRKVAKGGKIAVMIVDYWSRDTYVWSAKLHDETTYEFDKTYTLDLTYQEPDIAIESIAFHHSNNWDSKHFGYVRTKNIGAATPADEGNFYLFGHEERIFPGRHYPNYPNDAPYFSLVKETASEVTISSRDMTSHSTHTLYCEYLEGNHDMLINYATTSTGSKTEFAKFWSSTLSAEFGMVHSGLDGGWVLPRRIAKNAFENMNSANNRFYTTEMVNSSGASAAVESDIVGMRMTMDRTGHVLYFPACGTLEPTSFVTKSDGRYIDKNAIAQRTAAYGNVVFMQENLQFVVNSEGNREPQLMLNSFDFNPTYNIGNGKPVRRTAPLYIATTVRPIYNLYKFRTENYTGIDAQFYYERYPILMFKDTQL